jgi:hypothetical protein
MRTQSIVLIAISFTTMILSKSYCKREAERGANGRMVQKGHSHETKKNYSITLISLTLQNSTPAARLTTERQAEKRKCESFGQMALMMTRSSCDNHFIPPSVQATPREGDSLCRPYITCVLLPSCYVYYLVVGEKYRAGEVKPPKWPLRGGVNYKLFKIKLSPPEGNKAPDHRLMRPARKKVPFFKLVNNICKYR